MPAYSVRMTRHACVLMVLLAATAITALAITVDVNEEYNRRVRNLAPDDIAGHLDLALWCKDQKAWSLLRDECTHILRQQPDHAQADLLLQLAKAKLRQRTGEEPAGETTDVESSEPMSFVRVITNDEVQKLRRAELSRTNPERVTVKFTNDVLDRFAAEAFGPNREAKAEFMRSTPARKAQIILSASPEIAARFASDIVILSDPWLFREFEKGVLPIVTEGCASAQCHGGPDAKGFRLITGRRLTTNKIYTNYLILHAYEGDPPHLMRLINRAARGYSLILFWGQESPVYNEVSPPPHPVEIPPIFKSTRDPKYLRTLRWVEALATVAPDYDIDIRPTKEP